MSSPFEIFRRHEKILMVVATGLAMVSFVLLGAINDPRNLDPSLMVILLAALIGVVAWLFGIQKGKGSEWGVSGVLVGAVVGLAVMMSMRESAAVVIDSGNLSQKEFVELQRQRAVANQFLQRAFYESGNRDMNDLQSSMFGFMSRDQVLPQDVVLGELLRRKADEMGVAVPEDAVTKLISRVSDDKLTVESFTKIRRTLQVSEQELLAALASEMKAQQVFSLIQGQNHLQPQDYWEFYKKLNVQQSAQIVAVPLDDFVGDEEPADAELLELFAENRGNFPNYAPDGTPNDGRPGFFQPRRVKLGYFEVVYDDIEPLVKEPTEEEIQKRYEEQYKREMPAPDLPDGDLLDLPPSLRDLELPKEDGEMKKEGEKPAGETPPAEEAKPETPAPEKPAEKPTEEKPAEEKAPAAEPESKTEAKPEAEAKPEEKPEAPEKSEDEAPKETTEEKSQSSLVKPATQLVAFYQEDGEAAPAEEAKSEAAKPETEKPEAAKAEEPKAEAPKEDPAKPEEKADTPKETPKPEGDKPAENKEEPKSDDPPAEEKKEGTGEMKKEGEADIPPAPESDIRPLDDALKGEIRQDLLREKTLSEIEKRAKAAQAWLTNIALNVALDSELEGAITIEQAREQIETYAADNKLIYLETPLLSQEELRDAEDFPIGEAITSSGSRQPVYVAIFQTAPTLLYNVGRADRFITDSAFVYWKLEDKEAYSPETMDDEMIREQVVAAWKEQQAQPKAMARAEELAKKVRESDKPMAEVLGTETVTGSEDSLFLTVAETGNFTWMQSPAAPQRSMQSQPARQSIIPGVEDAGETFFEAVFAKDAANSVIIAPNRDKTVYYVVKVSERKPSTDEEWNKLRDEFMADLQQRENTRQLMRRFTGRDMPDTYSLMEMDAQRRHMVNWVDDMFEEHGVQIFGMDEEQG